jgi:hypothetical protein
MKQLIEIEETSSKFVKGYADYGFHSSDELVNEAIRLLMEEVNQKRALEQSADLYAEVYAEDKEAKIWVQAALNDWK